MIKIDAERDFAFRLESRDVSGNEVASGRAVLFAQCEERRYERCRRMTAQRVVAVIEVERVRGRAIDEGSVERADPLVGAEYGGRPTSRSKRAGDDLRRRILTARQRHADGIEYADFRPVNRGRRQVGVLEGCNAIGEF